LGIKYTPLRKEFWDVPEKNIKEKVKSLMVTFGGSDTKNMTPKVMKLLNKEYPELNKNVIIGKAFQNIDDIKKCVDKNTNLIYYPDAEKMKEIMLEVDIAISAGGQTLYEFARIGVPTIGVCIAENQLGNIREWENIDFLEYVGWYTKKNIIKNIDKLLKNMQDIKIRESKSKTGRKVIDGKGSLNLVDKVISSFF